MNAAKAQQPQRPRLLQAAVDAFAQPDLRKKILFTLAMLVIFRFVAHVPIPGVNRELLSDAFDNNALLGFFNLFSGGALRNLSVAALGVYPYITASIIMQVLVPIVPSLQALSREGGEQGRNRIQLYTHWMAVPLAIVQGYSQLLILERAGAVSGVGLSGPEFLPTIAAVISMAAGTMFLVWLGELITENGIGNGISIIIFAGIVAGLPTLLPNIASSSVGLSGIGMLLVLGVLLLAFIVFVQEAQRRIPVQYARSLFRGGRMYRQSGATHIPLKVNSAGMIPLIFAFSAVIMPAGVAQTFQGSNTPWIRNMADRVVTIVDPNNWGYYAFVFVLVVVFTFFYSLVVFQQQNLAENLQKQGGFVPGIRPGRPTQEYILRVLVRITWGGAIFLGFIAVVPFIATFLTDVQALTIGATGLLIVVGVVLDTMRQLESQLLMRDYSGFIR
jgi:preprotein translocase subunit SecY